MTQVAIALVRHDRCYLVGVRGPGRPLAGFAEFPGGKCLSGEAPEACVVRECLEETGLAVRPHRLRRRVEHTYPYGPVELYFFDCTLAGDCDPQCVQNGFQWVPIERLVEFTFPAPNEPLIAELIAESGPGNPPNST